MPVVFDASGRFVFAIEIKTHHGTNVQCNHPSYAWISVARAEAGDWERIWLVPTSGEDEHQGEYLFSHFSTYLKLSGYSAPDPVYDSTTLSGRLPIFMDPLPERGQNWFSLRVWNGTAFRYIKAQPGTADIPLIDSDAVGDWEGFQLRVLPISVRTSGTTLMQATSATALGTYTGSVTDTERFQVEQCPHQRAYVYLRSKTYGSYVTYIGGTVQLANKSPGSIFTVEQFPGSTTGQVQLRFRVENKFLSAPATGGFTVATTAAATEAFDIIYA